MPKWLIYIVIGFIVLNTAIWIYVGFIKDTANGTITTIIKEDSLTVLYRDCTLVLTERFKIIEKHYEAKHGQIDNLADSLLLDNANALADTIRFRNAEIKKY